MMRAAGFWILAALGLGAPLGDRLAAALHDQRFAAVGLGLLISALALAPSDREGRGTLRALLSTLLGALLIQVVPLPLGDGWDDVLALGTFTGIGALFFSLGIASHFRGGGRAVALYAVIGAPTHPVRRHCQRPTQRRPSRHCRWAQPDPRDRRLRCVHLHLAADRPPEGGPRITVTPGPQR